MNSLIRSNQMVRCLTKWEMGGTNGYSCNHNLAFLTLYNDFVWISNKVFFRRSLKPLSNLLMATCKSTSWELSLDHHLQYKMCDLHRVKRKGTVFVTTTITLLSEGSLGIFLHSPLVLCLLRKLSHTNRAMFNSKTWPKPWSWAHPRQKEKRGGVYQLDTALRKVRKLLVILHWILCDSSLYDSRIS
jgi:hypothetical protein